MTEVAPNGADSREGVGSFGLWVLLASLGVLFLASLVSVWWLHDDPELWPDGLPPLPGGLWLSTGLLGLLSWLMRRGVQRGPIYGVSAFRVAFAVSLLFLGAQAWNWRAMFGELPEGAKSLYAFHFYALTLLHAAHVVGGVIWHLVALGKRSAGTWRLVEIYWHFLGVVWLLLLATLWLVRVDHDFGSLPSTASLSLLGAATAVCIAYLVVAFRVLWERGEHGFAVFGLFFPPFALLQVWGRAEELGTMRLALRWGAAQVVWLVLLIFAGAVHASWMRTLDL